MDSASSSKASANADAFFTYRIDLNYIGTGFQGWQSQPDGNTVQDAIEKALATVLREPVRIAGASRTDTGVHAEHQVATFRCPQKVDTFRLFRSLQALVPQAIGILSVTEAPNDFHPILAAHAKLYRYRVWTGPGTNAFVKPYCWTLPYSLDSAAIRAAMQEFKGRHNFQSFAAVDGSAKTFERTILDFQLVEKGESLLEFYVLGEGFLKQMVRNLIGTLVEVGTGKRAPADMRTILAARDRRAAGMTAPAAGLSLVEIHYEPCLTIASRFLAPGRDLSFVYPSVRTP